MVIQRSSNRPSSLRQRQNSLAEKSVNELGRRGKIRRSRNRQMSWVASSSLDQRGSELRMIYFAEQSAG